MNRSAYSKGLGCVLAWVLLLSLSAPGWAQTEGEVTVWAKLGGAPVDVRVVARLGDTVHGIFYSPAEVPGIARFSLPAGTYTLVVEHGAGFARGAEVRTVTVRSGENIELTVEFPVGFSASATWGYYAVDLHAHSNASFDGSTPPDELVAVQRAAGLDVGFLSDHNTGDGHAPFAEMAARRGFPVILGVEITAFRWHWVAYPVEAYVPQIPPMVWMGVGSPAPTFAEARQKGAQLIQVAHPFWAGAPYFDALERPFFDDGFDLVEIANGEFSDDDERTIEQLFRFWNDGRRYVAVAVSDAHHWKDPAHVYGRPRTYVHVEGDLTVEALLDALGRGRAFATYGPLVNFTAQGTARPGDTVVLKGGEEIRLQAELFVAPREEPRGLAHAEVIRNGTVVRQFALEGKSEGMIAFTDTPTASGWYIVRVVATDGDQAWTNPIWVEVN